MLNQLTSPLQAKHIQFVSGVDSVSYWSATFSWDFINFLVPALGILILFAAFQVDNYKGEELGILFFMLVSKPVYLENMCRNIKLSDSSYRRF